MLEPAPEVQIASSELPTKIELSDIRPHPIEKGATELVLQRHGKYIRDYDDPNIGSLTTEAAADAKQLAKDYFEGFLNQLPQEEKKTADVLFVASDTQYHEGGRRSYETASIAQQAAQKVFEENKIPNTNIVNVSHQLKGSPAPRPMPRMHEPQMFTQSPDFVEFLKENHGDLDVNFWIAFEEDRERETRIAKGAEGPDEIADRMHFSVRTLARYAEAYHRAKPGRRLIIWADTHYDTISPYVKRNILGVGKEHQLLVDYGAGVTIDIDSAGKATTELGGQQYMVSLQK